MLQMYTAFIYMPGLCSWLWHFSPVFNMDIQQSFSKRTNASLSFAPSGPVTSVCFVSMLAMHATYGKIFYCHWKMKLVHMVLAISQN